MKHLMTALAALALSACNQTPPAPAPSEAADAPMASSEASPEPAHTATVAAVNPGAAPAASPSDLSAPTLVPEADKGETGARNILLEWARAVERRDFARADAQWGAGTADAKSAKRFGDYASITVGFGDGDVEGAAGSLYYEVPLMVTGKRKVGIAVKRTGSVVVRRVNDVDGATPAQLRWHISGITLEP